MRRRVFFIGLVVAAVGSVVFGGTALAGDPRLATVVEANLQGSNVVPGPGDPDGSGNVHMGLYPTKNKICYKLTVDNIALPATAAHLHEGGTGEVSPVRLRLKAPGSDGFSRECIRGLSERFIRKVKRDPSNYYVDVHTSDFQGGALRGQLFRP